VSPSKEMPDTVGAGPSGPARARGLERCFGLTLKPRIGWSTSAVHVAPEPRARHDKLFNFLTGLLPVRRTLGCDCMPSTVEAAFAEL
jgi:hypothetical protein